jgi:DNA-binding beta-propeller fold protein YncE
MKTPGGAHGRFTLQLSGWSLASLLAAGCNLDNPGVEPPSGEITYPIALALSREVVEDDPEQIGAPRFLYVANSNFDLRYNAGSVQAYDLQRLYELLLDADRSACLDKLGGEDLPLLDAGVAGDAGAPMDASLDAGLPMDAALDTGTAAALDAGGDAAMDSGSLLDGGTPDAAADAASLEDAGEDAGLAMEAGVSDAAVNDAGEVDAGAANPGVPIVPTTSADAPHGPSYYGTVRGILCDGRDEAEYADDCCYTRQEIADADLLLSEVFTGSYASGIALSPDGKRMYVPLRSGGRLVYLDIESNEDGVRLGCGGDEDDCERGPNANSDDEVPDGKLAPYPTSLVAAPLRDLGVDRDETFVAMTHERGQVSLFVERDGAPVLEDVYQYPAQVLTSMSLSPPGLFGDELPRLLHVTAASTAEIARFGVRLDSSGTPDEDGPREILYPTSSIFMNNLSFPTDLRAVEFDPTNPRRIFALIRGVQQAVAFVEFDPNFENEANVVRAIRIGAGPSKLTLTTLGSRQLLLASTYDARTIEIIDTHTRELIAQVRGLSGPFDMVVDEVRELLYVADFRASVLRVVDMRGLSDPNMPPPRIVATLGSPRYAEGPN